MRRSRACLFTLLLVLAGLPPAQAENPRLTLKLENVTAAEAIQRLSTTTRVLIELRPRAAEGAGARRASFTWNDVTLGTALRQLCAEFGLRPFPAPAGAGVALAPAGAGAAGMGPKVGVVKKNGVKLYLRQISVNSQRSVDFMGGQGADNSRLSITFGAELPLGEPDAIAGVSNVAARDDQGNFLLSDGGLAFEGPRFLASLPDEWTGMALISPPHPRAKKLVWIEGDLLVYKDYQTLPVEVPLPVDRATARQAAGDRWVEVVQFEAGAPRSADRPPAGDPLARTRLQARVFIPGDPAQLGLLDRGSTISPVLVGASGKTYRANGTGTRGNGYMGGMLYELDCSYPPVPEPVQKAVFRLVQKSDPQPLLSFRMTDVPLPEASPFLPRRTRPPFARSGGAGTVRPYHDPAGGSLLSPIRIADRPAGEGTLSVGLSVQEGRDWSGVRWIDVDVPAGGAARLPDLKPGTYRILRVYRPASPPQVSGAGSWQGGEVTATVQAGKESQLPPLRWAAEPAAKAGQPTRPPRAKQDTKPVRRN